MTNGLEGYNKDHNSVGTHLYLLQPLSLSTQDGIIVVIKGAVVMSGAVI